MLRSSFAPCHALLIALSLAVPVTVLPACADKSALSPEEQAAQNKKDLQAGATRVRDEKYDEAEVIFDRVLAADPENAEALAGMGRVKLGQKKLDDALAYLERAAGKAPEDPALQASLGELYAKLDRHMDAATAYGVAFAADPNNGNLGIAQGTALRKAKQLDRAETVLREVAKSDAQAEYVYTELGDVLRAQGKLDDALNAYMKALIEHVGDQKAHAGAAEVYELQNNRGKAIDEWSTYIRMDCCSEFSNTVAKKRIKALQDAAAAD